MKYKYILFLICIIIMVISIVMTTQAFLTYEVATNNSYAIGNVKITLDESNVDELGKLIDNTRVQSNDYHLLPGYTYIKDPTITLKKDSVDSYVRILVTVNKINELKILYGNDFKLEDIYHNWGQNWTYYGKTDNDNQITYEYRYNLIVNGIEEDKKLEPLFEGFTIPQEATAEQLKQLENFEIKIVGHAIQSQGFENAEQAWLAFYE